MEKEIPVLFEDNTDCCGCGACMNVCPKGAISMQEDECGFLYPHINESLCIKCGLCKNACAFRNIDVQNVPLEIYAAVTTDKEILEKSASGGVFAMIAKNIIDRGGIAIGAELQNDFSVRHIIIDSFKGIGKLQGSKYVQSDLGYCYKAAEKSLLEKKLVLFSGTPCQVAGLYGYLGKEYENLLTIDIICHGVPSNRMFQDYITFLEQRNGGKIEKFAFRDKEIGWGINGSVIISGRKKWIWQSKSSYLYYFAKGWLYRKNCYKCKYASSNRPADITIGDYWGIEKQHPEYIGKGKWDESKGISLVILNTKKGKNFIGELKSEIELKPSSIEKAAMRNAQLQHPSKIGKREIILNKYKEEGWYGVEEEFRKNIGLRYYGDQLKALIPKWMKQKLKSYF